MYWGWSPSQWAFQNTFAAVLAFWLTAFAGETGRLAWVFFALCGLTSCVLGLRKSWKLGLVGLLTAPFAVLGTLLMIALTWRRKTGGSVHGIGTY